MIKKYISISIHYYFLLLVSEVFIDFKELIANYWDFRSSTCITE